MMLKVLTVIMVLIACCYCADNEVLVEDGRAKKKKNAFRIWAMVLLFMFSKVVVFKVASFMFFFMMFQKLFYFAGILLNFFMKQKIEKPGPAPGPPAVYGPPVDYNTIGYSYGPPEPSHSENVYPGGGYPGTEYGLPSLTELGGSFNNWLLNKKP